MNSNKISPKINARLDRIKKAARVCQCLLGTNVVFGVYCALAFLFAWPFPHRIRIPISPNHIYSSLSEMPGEIFALFLVQEGLIMAAYVALFALFRLYGQGILFSVRNILLIRVLGYCIIINWLLNYQMQSALADMALSMTPLFVGLMIIFVAWVMDEGRKIREEQELTV